MSETWTLSVVDGRDGIVKELDIKAECDDGRNGVITMMCFPGGKWLAPAYLDLPAKMAVSGGCPARRGT
ncbi:hypothetical protein [Mycolicibacterium setense]